MVVLGRNINISQHIYKSLFKSPELLLAKPIVFTSQPYSTCFMIRRHKQGSEEQNKHTVGGMITWKNKSFVNNMKVWLFREKEIICFISIIFHPSSKLPECFYRSDVKCTSQVKLSHNTEGLSQCNHQARSFTSCFNHLSHLKRSHYYNSVVLFNKYLLNTCMLQNCPQPWEYKNENNWHGPCPHGIQSLYFYLFGHNLVKA